MVKALWLATLGLLVSGSVAAQEILPSPEVQILLNEEAEFNSKCRGGSGDKPETWEACEKRDALDAELLEKGWCYGKINQAGFEMTWHPCASDSLANKDPSGE